MKLLILKVDKIELPKATKIIMKVEECEAVKLSKYFQYLIECFIPIMNGKQKLSNSKSIFKMRLF